MKFLFKKIYRLFISFFLCIINLQGLDVRVLLESNVDSIIITSSKDLIIKDPVSFREIRSLSGKQKFEICLQNDGAYLGKKKIFNESLMFVAQDGESISYKGKKYKGALVIKKVKDVYFVINNVSLEEYVFSVLKTESWPGWPLEINRVLAIVIRTYCLYQMVKSYQLKQIYDIRNTNHHQTYHGVHTCKTSRQAVEDTRGVFISYKNSPILAMFDCCCGGVIPGHIENVIDFSKAPYLQRNYACTYCKNIKIYHWSAVYTLDNFIDLIQSECDSIVHDIKDIKVVDRDEAGLVKKIIIKTSRGVIDLDGGQVYRLSNKIKSFNFVITKKGKKISFKGKGFGHHIGLCQWGAREMVKLGFNFKEILKFYYPDTTLLSFSDGLLVLHKKSKKGALCQGIKDILSVVQLRLVA